MHSSNHFKTSFQSSTNYHILELYVRYVIILGVPSATIPSEISFCFGEEAKIDAVLSSFPPLEGASWQKSSDSVTFENIDIDHQKYYGSKTDPTEAVLTFTNATFDDMLYYRLHVWNKIGESVSNVVHLNVTGSKKQIVHNNKNLSILPIWTGEDNE